MRGSETTNEEKQRHLRRKGETAEERNGREYAGVYMRVCMYVCMRVKERVRERQRREGRARRKELRGEEREGLA